MAVSTARACFRRLSPFVYSQRSSQASCLSGISNLPFSYFAIAFAWCLFQQNWKPAEFTNLLFQNVPGQHYPLNLTCTLIDCRHSYVTVHTFVRVISRIAFTPMNLHHIVADPI